ncbi:MAG: multicopper oxidase domain-containing protein [Gemmatimonadaceae bacterium]
MLTPIVTASLVAGIHAQLVAPLPRRPLPRPSPAAAKVAVNDNRIAAGTQTGKVLHLALDVVEGAWHPEGPSDPEVPAFAFAEPGKAPQIPGPLIRVRQGSEVRLVLRSRVDSAMVIHGLRPGAGLTSDTVHVAARATREVRYRLDKAGTYYYWGAFNGSMSTLDRLWLDSQLNGAIVVDPIGGSPPDRILVMSEWFHPHDSIAGQPFEDVLTINGKAWPYTERLTLRQGDSAHFRIVNVMPVWHPMHLHGFYYRVTARGTGAKDGPIAPEQQPLLNTDLLPPDRTLTLSFLPTTPGNWLFHCHFSFHMDHTVTLSGAPADAIAAGARPHIAKHDSEHHMRGLVVGLTVTPAADYKPYDAPNARNMRLLVQKRANSLVGGNTAYGFVLQSGDSVPKRDSVNVPGPVLELRRGEPVRINVINNLTESTGIHWHGLEIESFPDGVPDFSGMGGHVFRPIAPNDSFVAAFTPPRSGTFPYHSHLNERHQISSGMYGAIIVTDKPRDLVHDHLIVAGGGGPEVFAKIESPFALVNGRRSPRPLRLTVGEVHRLRIVSIHPDWRISFTLRNDSTIAKWRAVAKDGADLPTAQATLRTAHVEMGPGETADFEFRPTKPGEWQLEVKSIEPGWHIPLRIVVIESPKQTAKRRDR